MSADRRPQIGGHWTMPGRRPPAGRATDSVIGMRQRLRVGSSPEEQLADDLAVLVEVGRIIAVPDGKHIRFAPAAEDDV